MYKEQFDYSVIIRTTGKAGEKYQKLLNSIKAQNIQPKEVIVVLPNGVDRPKETIGVESYYYSPKGMVKQRQIGIDLCKTPYALICDDDVSFPADFVEKLYRPISEHRAALSAGPLYSFLPPKGGNAIIAAIMGAAVPTVLHKERYNTVLRTTGYSYNRYLDDTSTKYYETQSAAWTCFFADIVALRSIHFEHETWLDAHGYSAQDDKAMFYKAWMNGKKTVIVSDAFYEHLDGKTSTIGNRPHVTYSRMFNMVVFWHRFLYKVNVLPLGKIADIIALAYRLMWIGLWDIQSLCRKKIMFDDMKISIKALIDALYFIKSDEYRTLPPVICDESD